MRKEFKTKEERATYQSWLDMKGRCYRPTSQRFYTHGARGIVVCDQWKNSFDIFLQDMGLKPNGYSIERLDNDGNYEPSNCKWATAKEQSYNRRTNIRYLNKTVMEWAKELNLSHAAMQKRFNNWPVDEAINTPVLTNYIRKKH